MGANKLLPASNAKKDVYASVSNIRVATPVKATLVKISSEEIQSKRTPAYRYLLP
jgi:hypothetical protein